nr:head-tail connector protein [uncultured Ligilactobacillus sp.]
MPIQDLKVNVEKDDIDKLKNSLRLPTEDTFDDDLLKSLILTARNDIIGQVGEKIDDFFDNNELFNTAVILEASHLYVNRIATTTVQTYEVPMALYSLINSMKDDYRLKIQLMEEDSNEKSQSK